MKKFLLFFIFFLFLVLLFWCYRSRISGPGIIGPINTRELPNSDSTSHWVNWNLLFTPTSLGDKATIIQALEDSLKNYVHDSNSVAMLLFHYTYCPCDSFLTNMDVTAIWGTGQIVSPPPTKPKPGPSGDFTVGNNFGMTVPDYSDTVPNFLDTNNILHHGSLLIPGAANSRIKKLLAVIDTGLDTLLFKRAYPNAIWAGNLLWQENILKNTIFDVVPGESNNSLIDNAPVKHGTSATHIILTQMSRMTDSRIPSIMSVRAFDDSERGSIYTVSCAISYAIKNNADFINASWGYYGPLDSVLRYYIKKANDRNKPVRIVAAAGNLRGKHLATSVCGTITNPDGFLDNGQTKDDLFYPACFSTDFPNLVTATQMNSTILPGATTATVNPCFYQNYSQRYVTVGALEKPDPIYGCCKFKNPFLASPIEGSSFATPVITAWLMNGLWNQTTDIKSFINAQSDHQTNPMYTVGGSYHHFNQIP